MSRRLKLSVRQTAMALAATVCIVAGEVRPVAQEQSRFLAKEQITFYGIGLKVEPAQQTVPKDIATIVSTFLQAPDAPGTGCRRSRPTPKSARRCADRASREPTRTRRPGRTRRSTFRR